MKRVHLIFAFILAVLLVLCSASISIASSYSTDWTLWDQDDSDDKLMQDYGCLIVAMSRMLVASKAEADPSFNPDTFMNWEYANGYLDSQFYQTNVPNAPVAYSTQKGRPLTYIGSWSSNLVAQIWENISNGYYSIVHYNSGSRTGHWVFINNEASASTGTLMCYQSDYPTAKGTQPLDTSGLQAVYAWQGDVEPPSYISDKVIVSDITPESFKITYQAEDNWGILSCGAIIWPTESFTHFHVQDGVYDEETKTVTIEVDIDKDIQYLAENYSIRCFIQDIGKNGPVEWKVQDPVSVYCLDISVAGTYKTAKDAEIRIAPMYSFNGFDTLAHIMEKNTQIEITGMLENAGQTWYQISGNRLILKDDVTYLSSWDKFKNWVLERVNQYYYNQDNDVYAVDSPKDDVYLTGGKKYTIAKKSLNTLVQTAEGNISESFIPAELQDFAITVSTSNDVTSVGIAGYTGSSREVVIPSEIEGYPVTSIVDGAFFGDKTITSVVIPESINSIGYSAFEGCSNITNLVLPHNAELYENDNNIGHSAFNGLTNLREITIPVEWDQGSAYYGQFCISGSNQIEKIHYIKSSIGVMVDRTSNNVNRIEVRSKLTLKEVDFEEGIISIGSNSFRYGDEYDWVLSSVKLPSTLNSIGENAFCGLSELKLIDLPEAITEIKSCAFTRSGLLSVILPEQLEIISDGTFLSCVDLQEVVIPSNVNRINAGAFSGCTSLTAFPLNGNNTVVYIGNSAFDGCTGLISVILPESLTGLGYSAFEGCSNITNLVLPHNEELYYYDNNIGHSAFNGLTNLREITIPVEWDQGSSYYRQFCISGSNQIEKIHYIKSSTGVMIDRTASKGDRIEVRSKLTLKEIDFEEGITSIGTNAYKYYDEYDWALSTVKLPSTLKSIGEYAFYGNMNLESILIPSSVVEISDSAFGSHAESFVIYGYTESEAENYANKYNIPFVAIDAYGYGMITNGGTNMRSGPARSYQSICKLDRYTIVKITGDLEDNFFPVSCKSPNEKVNISGFISCEYVRPLTDENLKEKCLSLPEQLMEVEEDAFSGVSEIYSIRIPTTVNSIADTAFPEKSILIITEENSYAYSWALKNGYLVDSRLY